MRKIFNILFVCLFSSVYSQELNCKVVVNYDKITNTNNQIFKSLETSFLTDKMSAEWWLCTKNPIKSELWNSMINHYHYRYERNMYDN